MFIGHYAMGMALKKQSPTTPLWLMFIAVQLTDILAFALVLLGVEQISYNPSQNPFLRTVLEYVPYSHSLSAHALLSLVVLVIFWKLKGRRWGIVLSIGVLSHWFIDALVHSKDLPLIHDSWKVGLGLWELPWIAFATEVSMFLLASLYLFGSFTKKIRLTVLIVVLLTGFTAMVIAPESPVSSSVASITSISFYIAFALIAYWSERAIREPSLARQK